MSVGIEFTFASFAIQVEIDALKIGSFLVKDCDFLFQYDYATDYRHAQGDDNKGVQED